MALKKSQKSLKKWTKQKWRTKSGKPSTQGAKATGERYLPEKAWAAMSKSERKKTDDKKKRESRKGKQFVENTERAKKARKAVSKAEKRKMGQG